MKFQNILNLFLRAKDEKDKSKVDKRLRKLEEKDKPKSLVERQLDKEKEWLYED